MIVILSLSVLKMFVEGIINISSDITVDDCKYNFEIGD